MTNIKGDCLEITHEKGGRKGPMPMAAWRPIETWLHSADTWLRTAAKKDRPPCSDLVLEALRAGAIPGIAAASVRPVDDGASVECKMRKPVIASGGGTTIRKMDVEVAVLFALLLFSGGRLFIDWSGSRERPFFYGRLSTYDSGEDAMPYVSRIIANTAPGIHTREGAEFHDWRRSEWSYTPPKEGDTAGKHGLEGAVAQAKAAFAKALQRSPDKLPPGLTEERFADFLDLAHGLMDRLPLNGQEG